MRKLFSIEMCDNGALLFIGETAECTKSPLIIHDTYASAVETLAKELGAPRKVRKDIKAPKTYITIEECTNGYQIVWLKKIFVFYQAKYLIDWLVDEEKRNEEERNEEEQYRMELPKEFVKRHPKSLHVSDADSAKSCVPDIKKFGNPDKWKLVCKASSEAEGWMKSTKAFALGQGWLVQVTTQQRNGDGTYSLAEAITYVPGVVNSPFAAEPTK